MSCDVSLVRCTTYDLQEGKSALTRLLEPLGGLDWVAPGMKIVIKANLVAGRPPEDAVTTHPALLSALSALLTERGASFGYNTLVTDMRGLAIMRELGYPVVMDATHSVQIPGGQGTSSGGQSQYVPHMARAAAAVGIDALFLEVHDNPAEALSDGPNMVKLDNLEKLLTDVLAIDKIVRG